MRFSPHTARPQRPLKGTSFSEAIIWSPLARVLRWACAHLVNKTEVAPIVGVTSLSCDKVVENDFGGILKRKPVMAHRKALEKIHPRLKPFFKRSRSASEILTTPSIPGVLQPLFSWRIARSFAAREEASRRFCNVAFDLGHEDSMLQAQNGPLDLSPVDLAPG